MPRAIAIAAIQEQSFRPAWESAKNLFVLMGDLMYGTDDRVKITYTLALALAVLGYALNLNGAGALGCEVI